MRPSVGNGQTVRRNRSNARFAATCAWRSSDSRSRASRSRPASGEMGASAPSSPAGPTSPTAASPSSAARTSSGDRPVGSETSSGCDGPVASRCAYTVASLALRPRRRRCASRTSAIALPSAHDRSGACYVVTIAPPGPPVSRRTRQAVPSPGAAVAGPCHRRALPSPGPAVAGRGSGDQSPRAAIVDGSETLIMRWCGRPTP
jgi:hypothetical protein